MFFDNWEGIVRAFIITILGYSALIIAIRISGKRTLAKMNAFDFIVTIALGSCLAAISLNKNIALAEGVVVLSTLIGLQFLITFASVRFKQVKLFVSGQPVMLVYKGNMLSEIMKKERITIDEIFVAARSKGIVNLDQIEVVILETTGDLNVILTSEAVGKFPETFKDVLQRPEYIKKNLKFSHP